MKTLLQSSHREELVVIGFKSKYNFYTLKDTVKHKIRNRGGMKCVSPGDLGYEKNKNLLLRIKGLDV